MTKKPNPLAAETSAERARLADLLAGLDPGQWATPSLCEGWQVRHVVAHMTMAFRLSPVRFFGGLARARFSFNRYADRAARADVERMSDADLLACLRDNIEHPWQPPGGGPAGALSHDVIHGLDITVPLGLPGPPTERIATVLRHTTQKSLDFFDSSWHGHRLVAVDTHVELGEGTPVRLPAEHLLLVVTGRRSLDDVRPTEDIGPTEDIR